MAGSDVAFPLPGTPDGPPASLAGIGSPGLITDYALASRSSGRLMRAAVSAPAEDLGTGLSFASRTYGDSREYRAGLGVGIPITEVPGLALGATFRGLFTNLGEVAGRGSSLDLSVVAPLPLPGVRASVAVAGEDLFVWTRWEDGGREDLASQFRAGTSVEWAGLGLSGEFRSVSGSGSREGIWAAGVEYGFRVAGMPVSVRTGYRDGTLRPGAATAGAGIRAGGIFVDYAVAGERESEGTVHVMGAGWRFGEGFRLPFGLAPVRRGRGPPEVVPSTKLFAPRAVNESMKLHIQVPPGEPVTGWSVMVVGSEGSVVWQESGEGAPPPELRWAGAVRDGLPVPDGEYLCRLMLRRGTAPVYLSPGSRLTVLHAFAQPRTVPATVAVPTPAPVPKPEPFAVIEEAAIALPLAIVSLSATPHNLVPGGGRNIEFAYEVTAPCKLALIIVGPGRRQTRPLDPVISGNLAGSALWDGLDTAGNPAVSGAYRATLNATTGEESASRFVDFRIGAGKNIAPAPQKAAPALRKAKKAAAPKAGAPTKKATARR